MPGNKFVYAHLLVTHDPFVFPCGWLLQRYPAVHRRGICRIGSEYIDGVLPQILEEIIAKSDKPPIIIVMGEPRRGGQGTADRGTFCEPLPRSICRKRTRWTPDFYGRHLAGECLPAALQWTSSTRITPCWADRSYDVWQTYDLADIDAVVKNLLQSPGLI